MPTNGTTFQPMQNLQRTSGLSTLTLTDGGPGDADGVANGVIVTAGGIYVP